MFNKYFINDDKMKLININKQILKLTYVSWQKKFAKIKIIIDNNEIFDVVIVTIKKKRDRFKKTISINENNEYLSSSNEFEKNVDHII